MEGMDEIRERGEGEGGRRKRPRDRSGDRECVFARARAC